MAGLYIHIPFCHSKCAYCDFFSTPKITPLTANGYIDALIREYNARKDELEEPIETIYLGGGTPSLLPVDLLQRLITALPVNNLKEFTIEVNPEDMNRQLASFISESPISRVSIGCQSFNDNELRAIGRRHSAIDSIKAIDLLRSCMIHEISCDLIYGLPYQTVESWMNSLETIMQISPRHISAYILSYEHGTRLYAMREAGKISETDDKTIVSMYNNLCELSNKYGYEHYEISNFALNGHRAIHNSNYWLYKPYLGLGTSAHSYTQGTRSFNPSDLRKYISSSYPVKITEHESLENKLNDYILISMRTSAGLDIGRCRALFGEKHTSDLLERSAAYVKSGKLIHKDGNLFIPEQHWLVSDSIICDLMAEV